MLILRALLVVGLLMPSAWSYSVWPQMRSWEDEILNGDAMGEAEDNSEVKINWGPVWDDIEGSNEFVVRSTQLEAQCLPPNGKGLQNLFKESLQLLPLKGIAALVDSYANDTEVIALKKFIRSTEYRQMVKVIRDSEEYRILKAYACHVLHIDLAELRDYISTAAIRSSGPAKGINGLLHKIRSIVPQEKLRDLYNRLMKSDDELVKAVSHLKSEEYQQLLMNLRKNVPAYKQLQQKLQSIGLPLDELRGLLGRVLGWSLDFDVTA